MYRGSRGAGANEMLATVDRLGNVRRVDSSGRGDRWGRLYGLGQGSTSSTVLSTAVSAGGAVAAPLATSAAAGALAGTAWTWAIPVIGPAIGLVTLGLLAWFHRKGPAQKVASTKIANELEPQLAQNLAAYFQGPRTRASQQVALSNFDQAWAYLVQACGNPQLGDPGKHCIADRQQGACKWKNDGKGGPAGSGTVCWNWFVGYRDPIANDPNVHDTPLSDKVLGFLQQGTLPLEQVFRSAGIGGSPLVWLAGLAVVLMLL